ncbi:hypothetical protein [Sporosarcina psychrophila]|uniref:Uncharacterized protein n=1 Tax=Sporosarcina psychrophila TaxID=1476 RepID=A0ABV2KDB7_SPOPS
MCNQLAKSVEYNQVLDMMYLAKDGQISKRRINVLQVGEVSFRDTVSCANPNALLQLITF